MKTLRNLVGVGLVVFSLMAALTAYGWAGHGHGGHRFGHGGEGFPFRMLKALNLTADQEAQVQAIRQAHEQNFKTLWQDLRSAKNTITTKLLTPGEITTEGLSGDTDRIAALTAQLVKERLAVGVEVRNILTPDQLARAAELVAKKKALREEWKNSLKNEQ